MQRLRLIDGSGYVYRAFFGLPAMQRSDGLPCNAVHGFCSTLWYASQRGTATHLCVVFDAPGKTFRSNIFADYKANRPPKPEAMLPQLPLMRDAAKAFNVASAEMQGYEADDLIATYARLGAEAGAEVEIVTSDKDLMQLVGGPVTIWDPFKKKRIGPAEVEEKFGVPPERVIDVLSLMGDATDNIPGVPSVGEKTAAQLIREFGDLDTLLENLERVKKPKLREKLTKHVSAAIMSRALVRLDDQVPIMDPLESFERRPVEPEQMCEFLRSMEFDTMAQGFLEQLRQVEEAL